MVCDAGRGDVEGLREPGAGAGVLEYISTKEVGMIEDRRWQSESAARQLGCTKKKKPLCWPKSGPLGSPVFFPSDPTRASHEASFANARL